MRGQGVEPTMGGPREPFATRIRSDVVRIRVWE
jgi:hypothetical protein